MGLMAFEIRLDCPSCRVEGARIETWTDSAVCRLGVPESVVCRMCRTASEGRSASTGIGETVMPGDGCPRCGAALDDAARAARRCPFCNVTAELVETGPMRAIPPEASVADVERALSEWAREEGLGGAGELLDVYFVVPSAADVHAAMARGEAVETTFDVADYLFSGGGGGGGGAVAGEPVPVRLVREEGAPTTLRLARVAVPKPAGGPREELLAIASVAAADGDASIDDDAVLKRAAARRGVAPLEPEDVRVWRPNEIEPPSTLQDREKVLEEMFQIALSDGQLDESELRVIREYARAWGVDPERLSEWTDLYSFGDQSGIERWFRRIGLFLFPAG